MKKIILILLLFVIPLQAQRISNWVSGSGGGNITSKDEGSNLSTATSSFDFVGAGVTATASGNDITVTIPGSGSATITTQEGDVTVSASTSTLDFGAGFDLTDSPAGETNIVLDLTEDQVNLTTEVTGELPDGNVADAITASNYLLLTAADDSIEVNLEDGSMDSLNIENVLTHSPVNNITESTQDIVASGFQIRDSGNTRRDLLDISATDATLVGSAVLDTTRIRATGNNLYVTSDSTTSDQPLRVTGTISGVNVTSGANPGHTHTTTSISGLDISDDTNLTASAPVTLTGDAVGVDTTAGNPNLATQFYHGANDDDTPESGDFGNAVDLEADGSVSNNAVDGTDIALGSDAQGDVMYYNGTDWVRLGAGTNGQVLHTQGAGANPVWGTDDLGGGASDSVYVSITTHDADGDTIHSDPTGFAADNIAGAGTRAWQYKDGATELAFVDTTGQAFYDKLGIGATNLTNLKMAIDNDANEIGLLIQAASPSIQTSQAAFTVEGSQGNNWFNVNFDSTVQTVHGIDVFGANDMDYGSGDVTDHTFTTDGTGDAEIVLPDQSISTTEILNSTLVDADMANDALDADKIVGDATDDDDLDVAAGGTGVSTLTDGGVLLGSGTGDITATAVLTNGQLLIGDGTTDPTLATLTGANDVSITNGAGSITIGKPDTLTKQFGVIDSVIVENLPGWKVPYNITIIEIASYTDANTTTFNIEERAETTPNTAGTDAMAADQVADNNQQETTSFSNAGFARNTWMVPTISATGDVETFSIVIRYVKD